MRICLSILCLMSCIFSAGCGPRRDPVTYFGVEFVNSEVGWIEGPGLALFQTLDSGKTWKLIDERGGGVQFIDAQYGWRMISSEVLRTTDGGLTWQSRLLMEYDSRFPYNSFHFVDQMTGWVVRGEGAIWHTSDGGATWEPQTAEMKARPKDVYFVNKQCGWIVGNFGMVLRTCNGGRTWETGHVEEDYALGDVQFVSEGVGWVVGADTLGSPDGGRTGDIILHSSDSGRRWSVQATLAGPGSVRDLVFLNETMGWVVGTNGLILYTSDGGKTWIHQESGTKMHLNSVSFIDENTGWAVGGWDEGDSYEDETGKVREGWFEGIILRTVNGGQTWERVESPVKRRRWF